MVNNTKLIQDRQNGDYTDVYFRNSLLNSRQFVENLELESKLFGHNGCVNCLQFSENGKILASASDDYRVLLWDPFRKKKTPLVDIQTPHRGNIFSVKFIPKTGNNLIVTGAADAQIFMFDINRQDTPIFKCNCHLIRVKRLAVAHDSTDLFWSCGEDGQVLQFDRRIPHHCKSDEPVVFVDLRTSSETYAEAKCVTVNPLKNHLLAVGANDVFARLYDRRMMSLKKVRSVDSHAADSFPSNDQCFDKSVPKGCCQYFVPGHLQNAEAYHKAITYLSFSPDGNELLANYGAEQIYLFNINNAESPVFLNLPTFPSQAPEKRPLSPEIAKIKESGNEYLEADNYLRAIHQYSKGIRADPQCSILYLNRATALMRRKWFGDHYQALKDCHTALSLDPYYYKAHFRISRALLELNKFDLAKEALGEFKNRFPKKDKAISELEHDINSALRNKGNYGERSSEYTENEIYWIANAKDFDQRFVGHCNTKTDIKEANFIGPYGTYIAAGSDDGNLYIWSRPNNEIVKVLKADDAIVNCVQPHPYTCLIASSGIDHEIRLWSPQPEDHIKDNTIEYYDSIINENQKLMQNDFFEFSRDGTTTMCRTS